VSSFSLLSPPIRAPCCLQWIRSDERIPCTGALPSSAGVPPSHVYSSLTVSPAGESSSDRKGQESMAAAPS
jgi:hypothetical protein